MLCTLKAWEDPVFCKQRLGLDEPLGSIDREKLNVNGGSLGRRATRSPRPAGASSRASPRRSPSAAAAAD